MNDGKGVAADPPQASAHARRRGIRTHVAAGILLTGWIVPSASSVPAGAATPHELRPLTSLQRQRVEDAGRLYNAGERAGGLRILDSLLTAAKLRDDDDLECRIRAASGGLRAWGGEAREADSLLRAVMPRLAACADTTFFLGAAVWFGKALLDRTRFVEAESVYGSILPIAARSGNPGPEGWAQMGLAYIALSDGRPEDARTRYEAATRLLRQAGNRYGEIEGLVGQGRAHKRMGDGDRARSCYAEACARAREYGLPRNEAIALNDLGVEEYARGDPAAALRAFRDAWRIGGASGDRWETTVPATNVAHVLEEMGRTDEAAGVLDSVISACRASGYLDYEAGSMLALGKLWNDAGRHRRAMAMYERVLGLGRELPISRRLAAFEGLAGVFERQGDPRRALQILEDERCLRIRADAWPDQGLEYDARRARLLVEVGSSGEGMAVAEEAAPAAERLHRADLVVSLRTTAARARLEAGDHREALQHLTRATEAWEGLRNRPSDPEWRELWANGQSLTSMLIQALLTDPDRPSEDARLRAAFEAAQRFKARGLAERIQGTMARSVPAPSISLESVQANLLRPGEVLLDAFVGPDTSFVFAVTRERCELIRLPGETVLSDRVESLTRLICDSGQEDTVEREAVIEEVALSLGTFILGPSSDLIATGDRILLAPDGMLHLLPLEMLRLEDSGRIGDRRVVARIPSVAQLARLRANPIPTVDDGSGLVCYGATGDGGRELGGRGRKRPPCNAASVASSSRAPGSTAFRRLRRTGSPAPRSSTSRRTPNSITPIPGGRESCCDRPTRRKEAACSVRSGSLPRGSMRASWSSLGANRRVVGSFAGRASRGSRRHSSHRVRVRSSRPSGPSMTRRARGSSRTSTTGSRRACRRVALCGRLDPGCPGRAAVRILRSGRDSY